jgi:hypothetical protein
MASLALARCVSGKGDESDIEERKTSGGWGGGGRDIWREDGGTLGKQARVGEDKGLLGEWDHK